MGDSTGAFPGPGLPANRVKGPSRRMDKKIEFKVISIPFLNNSEFSTSNACGFLARSLILRHEDTHDFSRCMLALSIIRSGSSKFSDYSGRRLYLQRSPFVRWR